MCIKNHTSLDEPKSLNNIDFYLYYNYNVYMIIIWDEKRNKGIWRDIR